MPALNPDQFMVVAFPEPREIGGLGEGDVPEHLVVALGLTRYRVQATRRIRTRMESFVPPRLDIVREETLANGRLARVVRQCDVVGLLRTTVLDAALRDGTQQVGDANVGLGPYIERVPDQPPFPIEGDRWHLSTLSVVGHYPDLGNMVFDTISIGTTL